MSTQQKRPKPPGMSAKRFVEKLKTYQSAAELNKDHRYFKFDEDKPGSGDQFTTGHSRPIRDRQPKHLGAMLR